MSAPALNPHTGLPPVRIGIHGKGDDNGSTYIVWDYVQHQQRAKWRAQWARADDLDCNSSHYKHYEWQLRNAILELEAREEQLRKAISFLTPEQVEVLCPQPTR